MHTEASSASFPLAETESMRQLKAEKQAARAECAERLAKKKSLRLERELKEAERIISDIKADAEKIVNSSGRPVETQ